MGGLIGYEGEFAILSSTPTATNQNAWIDFMKKKLASEPKYRQDEACSDRLRRGERAGQPAAGSSSRRGVSESQGHHHSGRHRAAGGARARSSRPVALDKIKLTGLAPATFMKKYIEDGSAQDIWWNVKDLGYLTYYAAQALAQCKITGKEGETFAAGRLGDYTVGADGEVVLGPADDRHARRTSTTSSSDASNPMLRHRPLGYDTGRWRTSSLIYGWRAKTERA